jgi:isoleucyl-tRNA synthetase
MTWFVFWNPKQREADEAIVSSTPVATAGRTYMIDMDYWTLARKPKAKKTNKEAKRLRRLVNEINEQIEDLTNLQKVVDEELEAQSTLLAMRDIERLYNQALNDAEERKKALHELELQQIKTELADLLREMQQTQRRQREEDDLLMLFMFAEEG